MSHKFPNPTKRANPWHGLRAKGYSPITLAQAERLGRNAWQPTPAWVTGAALLRAFEPCAPVDAEHECPTCGRITPIGTYCATC